MTAMITEEHHTGPGVRFPPPDPELAHLARQNMIFDVSFERAGEPLAGFTADKTGLSRTKIRALIRFGSVWVNGKVCRQETHEVRSGDKVTFQAPVYGPVIFYEIDEHRILFRDDWLIAYDKEAGIPCQQTPYDGYNHLYGALQRSFPGYLALHHRLDAATSGVMIFARRKEANANLSRVFSSGPLEKIYLAVVRGRPDIEHWITDLPIAKQKGKYMVPSDGVGKSARTEFTVLSAGPSSSLVQARPLTGRTHQIRVHLAHQGFPILGDIPYGGPPRPRLMLHACRLHLAHPVTNKALVLEAPAPQGFKFIPES
jgi:23S rRNA pseudouridine1911/1915/1917 synthase